MEPGLTVWSKFWTGDHGRSSKQQTVYVSSGSVHKCPSLGLVLVCHESCLCSPSNLSAASTRLTDQPDWNDLLDQKAKRSLSNGLCAVLKQALDGSYLLYSINHKIQLNSNCEGEVFGVRSDPTRRQAYYSVVMST